MFNTVGFIGSGAVTRSLAHHLLAAGVSILIANSRGSASLTGLTTALGEGARAVTLDEAARADLVILALPFVREPELSATVPDWTGRVVVDATNQFAQYTPRYGGFVDLGDEIGTEWVARHLPGATMIKAFNAMYASYIRPDPYRHEGRQVVFYAGDDTAAYADFHDLLTRMGFAAVHLGGLRDGGRLMQLGGPLNGLHVLKQD